LSDFSQPISFENAEIGQCPNFAPPPPPPPHLPEEGETEKKKVDSKPVSPPLTPAPGTSPGGPDEAAPSVPGAATPTASAAVAPPTAKLDPSTDLVFTHSQTDA
ncbi:hypothetical protein AMECASPLE_034277, partial [Ameca splendens]